MIDFVEYVVGELAGKRLSKADALALIAQFRGQAGTEVLHPLLHRNTSDLTRHSYGTTFDAGAFYLRDHVVDGRKVLPGVAYLEMVRAAVAAALPDEEGAIGLANVVWAQPIVVDDAAHVTLALYPGDGPIDYEVCGDVAAADGAAQAPIHSQGQAVVLARAEAPMLDLARLEAETADGQLDAAQVYAAYGRMGIVYGPAHRAVTALRRGREQVLARLALPHAVADTLDDYVLHPSLLDGAVQSAIGFIEDFERLPARPNLPFAVESVRIFAPCTREMVAWLRLAPGSSAGDRVTKLDIDLCDPQGQVCVQLHGFTSRTLNEDAGPGLMYAAPQWEVAAIGQGGTQAWAARHVLVSAAAGGDMTALRAAIGDARCVRLSGDADGDPAAYYRDAATDCFLHIKELLAARPQGRTLVQLVVAHTPADGLLLGLAGLLKTAALENPLLAAQIVVTSAADDAQALARQLAAEAADAQSGVVRYVRDERQVLAWRELDAPAEAPASAFKDGGVYLVTGGLGALGRLFARAILERTHGATVVLTGRAPASAQTAAVLATLPAQGGYVDYRQLDVCDAGQVRAVVAAVLAQHGRLDGILHAAGMTDDGFILNKTEEAFARVLAPKVAGTVNLDEATRDVALDFLVLFSGGAAVTGNVGQADYAAANGFMDRYAAYRNALVLQGRRRGCTRAVDWPLWEEGGMGADAATQERLKRVAGLVPMRTRTGLCAFDASLALPHDQVQVVEGDLRLVRAALFAQPSAVEPEPEPIQAGPAAGADLQESTEAFLKKRLSALLKLPAHRIDAAASFEKYGINSIMTMNLTAELEKLFGSLPKTLFFEYQTLSELAAYVVRQHRVRLEALFGAPAAAPMPAVPSTPAPALPARVRAPVRRAALRSAAGDGDAIAIVGLSGRYPGAEDVEQFWRNLRDGKDSIVEVPPERWNWRDYFSEDRSVAGRHYSKWGGFIDGVDEFDALFFNIPPVDAERIDPQERLFLQHAWMALEDAGYTRASLQIPRAQDQAGQVGVYVGVMYGEYQMFGAESSLLGERMVTPASYASIANRVSYFLNLHGPSMAVDTMCSSSLTAIHLACQDLRLGRTDAAIAGGVNVTIHPNKYLLLSAGQFIASDGRCQSFGVGGDGYIPAEGVGAVILKRLSDARRDGNHIYGVIRGGALNHGGKTHGYSVPNPQAQASVIARAFQECGVDPRHVGYIEAHGTGTKLGDPIEIAALSQVFRRSTGDNGFCLIGSAKSNIGHAESAAGIAGLTKVLLQMRHRQIVPSLHSAALNPNIDFDDSPFVVNQALCDWEAPQVDGRALPRIAGISSFGAGGSNAHLVVQEYVPAAPAVVMDGRPAAIVLSARTPEQLTQKMQDLLAFVRRDPARVDLHAVARTLQAGREAMEERFALVVDSVGQLEQDLQACLDGADQPDNCYRGQAAQGVDAVALFKADADLQATVAKWIAARRLPRLLELWTRGLELDWDQLYGDRKPRFVSLPTYPFARERCWIARPAGTPAGQGAVLHPLLHRNTSDFTQQSYRTTLTGAEFFLADHRVTIAGAAGRKVLPGVAYLEMARAAVAQALRAGDDAPALELRNVAWTRPLVVDGHVDAEITLAPDDGGQVDFEVHTAAGDESVVHCQGRVAVVAPAAGQRIDVAQVRQSMGRGRLDAQQVYAAYARMGLHYGPAHRSIAAIALGDGQALAELRLPASIEADAPDYLLHPSLMDGALQAAIGLLDWREDPAGPARLPFALGALQVQAPCASEMLAWVRYAEGSGPADAVVKLDIDLCDAEGRICVRMRDLCARALDAQAADDGAVSLVAVPAWETAAPAATMDEPATHHVLLCDMQNVDADALAHLLPGARCARSDAPAGSSLAARYAHHAHALLAQLRARLQRGEGGANLLQVVVPGDDDGQVLAGLAGMLRTARLENPGFIGQLIVAAPDTTAAALADQLRQDGRSGDVLVRYAQGQRQALRWRELPFQDGAADVVFKDCGVYLITGGLGGLGLLFAGEILKQASRATVVLTGRAPLDAHKRAALDRLPARAGRVEYRQLDLADAAQAGQLVAAIVGEHGRLDGIVHSAGMTADSFILKKSDDELAAVLAPKVTGTLHLDQATADVDLDFFVLFSSVSSALGNVGQADYAAANGFMDHFAAWRNGKSARGQRHGRTVAINWPLWQEGGMRIDAASRELLFQASGARPLRTVTGIAAFHRSLASSHGQVLVLEGDVARLRRMIAGETRRAVVAAAPAPAAVVPAAGADDARLLERTTDHLRKQFSDVLKVPAQRIDARAPLEHYGIDSVVAMKLTNVLEQTFGSLPKTLFFEYQTIAGLAGYLVKSFPAVARQLLDPASAPAAQPAAPVAAPALPALRRTGRFPSASAPRERAVAIVGVSGRYPMAENLDRFWDNLKAGRDCISEVPPERWDHERYYDPDRSKAGKTYAKWGGFLTDVDKFDPLFFNISPREAEIMDPQERLFLQTAWQTIEDAGYSRASLAGRRVGVYVGAMWGHYELFGADAASGAIPTSSHASIANRVSYFFDLRGPSMALDTMCSSSLTAIHLACEEIRRGNIDAALAGGVNLSIHPQKYLNLSQGNFAASDGRCRSFGAGGDGYVPGEGVGAVLLKPLEDALRDGDQVYAVVRASALNHGGKTNGYTVPNPNAQGDLIHDAMKRAGVEPDTLGYVETHGTGTALGDPIEIAGLQQAFGASKGRNGRLPIGSVKSNIGHLEAAAGIAAVTKALLQLKHGQLVPSLHAEPPNPNIDFEHSPFRVQTSLADWTRSGTNPRRVAVSSFGAGGANAHLILEEHVDTRPVRAGADGTPHVILLSARDAAALDRHAAGMAAFLEDCADLPLADIAYTSQAGRTHMAARLAVIASSVAGLKDKLARWIAAREADDVFHANTHDRAYDAGQLIQGEAGQAFLRGLLAGGDLAKAATLWTMGADIDWSPLHAGAAPRRVSLPAYPFARERYWIQAAAQPAEPAAPAAVEERRRLYYRPQWTATPLAGTNPPAGPMLVLDDSDAFFAALNARVDGGGINLALPGGAFAEIAPGVFTLDPASEAQFGQLVAVLEARGQVPRVVLHRHAPADAAAALRLGVGALQNACKALIGRKAGRVRFLSMFDGGDEAAMPFGAALAGFYLSLNLEHPGYEAKVVDIRSAPAGVDEQVRIALAELGATDSAMAEIRYDGAGVRHVRSFVAHDAKPAAPVPLKQGGVYLVTGGLGGLGGIVADYLAKQVGARLVLVGRSVPSAAQARRIASLAAVYLQADVARLADVEAVVREAKARFGRIDGVFHSAGVTRDAFLLKKTADELTAVLAPKVDGTLNLERATRGEALDLFVLFASVAGAFGNVGQCDYAYANRFLDAFAEQREALRLAGRRSGRTLSIDWPFWEEGGMAIPADALAFSAEHMGMAPLPTSEGIRCLEDLLGAGLAQAVALYGVPSKIKAHMARRAAPAAAAVRTGGAAADPALRLAQTQDYLKTLVGAEIKLAPERIDARERFDAFGIDSIAVGRLNEALARAFGALPKTLFYEYESIADLARYLVREHADALAALFGADAGAQPVDDAPAAEPVAPPVAARPMDAAEPIAIIGVHGYYPQARDLDDYWAHLRDGRDVVGAVPADRWDAQQFYDPDPSRAADGKIYCKWGAFLDGVDRFDAPFFNIEPDEARAMDPQERLFLQSVWSALEDAGYTRDSLKRRFPKARSAGVGVFVGVTTQSYQLLAGEGAAASALPWSIANRVSYFFDFQGPSMPVDTACSSSSVAIHLACESLRRNECQVAVAGGVNLYLHPSKYQGLCRKRMLAREGKCRSYGAGDDGFVPGEGVGTLILKPLARAIEDGDTIHAVIRASAVDHSGRSNGYAAPNPNAQAALIGRALDAAGIPAESIGYVEGHGTGTQLGDSLEVAALAQAFGQRTDKRQFCALGSVKANIGHAESAAGVAAVTKVLLQMKHRQLAPSLHADVANPNIEFERSPFRLQRRLSDWTAAPSHPRRALVNSFGAGGVNACVVLEEYVPVHAARPVATGPRLIVLSARTPAGLRDQALRLLAHIRKTPTLDLADVAHTLQVAREPMPERLAFVAHDLADLAATLERWMDDESCAGVARGSLDPRSAAKRLDERIAARDLDALARAWTAGYAIAWDELDPDGTARRIPLPTYPFAQQRHWVNETPRPAARMPAQLHPLISHNSSTLREVAFTSMLSGDAFYARDHQVNGRRVFPGAGLIELACASGTLAAGRSVRRIQSIVFVQPLVFGTGQQPVQVSLRPADDDAEYIVTSYDADREKVVHAEGVLRFQDGTDEPRADTFLPLADLIRASSRVVDGSEYYRRFAQAGIVYGPAFRTMRKLHIGASFALSTLSLADGQGEGVEDFILHPSLVDGALQTVAGMAGGGEASVPYLPFAIDEIEILHPLSRTCHVHVEEAEPRAAGRADVRKFNIRIANERGLVLVALNKFCVRALPPAPKNPPPCPERDTGANLA
ncbi:SDR family NAD(P)-dependent oxidoreductase [Massilia rhizosphaerae]|uniref:SDR family NAD(P)-dependent oxidoreductase n=1 Tax=Massilia rhizosphaerae TaxID=2784389 RepID=UPI0018DEA1F0|nr:SDR family NAD(P)-dependent oxidoreductase [Massilia rhizosphaerae]